MDTQTAIRERRAVKHFEAGFEIPGEDEAALLDLLRQAPTSFNIQNWRIVNVKDKELRAKLREAAWDQAQVSDASLLFVMCADVKAWDRQPERYWSDAPEEARDRLVPMIRSFYEGREWQQRDEAMRSIGIGAQTLMLAAKSMGYDSCPMIGFDSDKVAELIHLPEDYVVGMMLVIGKAAKPAQAKGGFIANDEVFVTDRFVA